MELVWREIGRVGRGHFQFFVHNKKCIHDTTESFRSLPKGQPKQFFGIMS